MQKLEYKIFNLSTVEAYNKNAKARGLPLKTFIDFFNELGEEGWELKCKYQGTSFVFMRPKTISGS